jgi:hypothetical protein
VPISATTWDLYRQCWAAGIPPQYRADDQVRSIQSERDRRHSSAIIAPPPPKALVNKFFAVIYEITAGHDFSILRVETERGDKRRVRIAA